MRFCFRLYIRQSTLTRERKESGRRTYSSIECWSNVGDVAYEGGGGVMIQKSLTSQTEQKHPCLNLSPVEVLFTTDSNNFLEVLHQSRIPR